MRYGTHVRDERELNAGMARELFRGGARASLTTKSIKYGVLGVDQLKFYFVGMANHARQSKLINRHVCNHE